MPLDPRKILHIQNVTNVSFVNRQRTVVLVTLSGGVYSYSTLQAIMRPLQVLNPQVLDNQRRRVPARPRHAHAGPRQRQFQQRRLHRRHPRANRRLCSCRRQIRNP